MIKNAQSSQGLALSNNLEAKKSLAVLLDRTSDALKIYGRTPEQLANTAWAFATTLSDFTLEQIEGAFKIWLQRSNVMPTPSDIYSLIKRNGAPPLDKSVYISLVQKRERTTFKEMYGTFDALTNEEKKYIQDYEDFMISG